jgi:hypothetical protein
VQKLRTSVYISTGSITIGNHALTYKGCCSKLKQKILLMPVRGVGIRDISETEDISITKVLSVPVSFSHKIKPKQQHYDSLEVDEFWTCAGSKKHKMWLIYACHRAAGEIVSYVRSKRNYKTAKKLCDKLKSENIT